MREEDMPTPLQATAPIGTSPTATPREILTAAQGAAVADLDQTITGTYVAAEVQAISDKVDALLAALRTSTVIAT